MPFFLRVSEHYSSLESSVKEVVCPSHSPSIPGLINLFDRTHPGIFDVRRGLTQTKY